MKLNNLTSSGTFDYPWLSAPMYAFQRNGPIIRRRQWFRLISQIESQLIHYEIIPGVDDNGRHFVVVGQICHIMLHHGAFL